MRILSSGYLALYLIIIIIVCRTAIQYTTIRIYTNVYTYIYIHIYSVQYNIIYRYTHYIYILYIHACVYVEQKTKGALLNKTVMTTTAADIIDICIYMYKRKTDRDRQRIYIYTHIGI